MKEYPSIQRDVVDQQIYAFDKLDGSNVRAEWTRKRGFYKFGKRHGLIDESDKMLGPAKQLIQSTYEESLTQIFKDNRWQNVVCFFEYHSPNSFAGVHADEPHEVTLFDVSIDKQGIIEPNDFIKIFKDIKTAKMLYRGNANQTFIDSVKTGQLEGMTFEGVVCKGKHISPGLPLMFKIKNAAWIEKLKSTYADSPEQIDKLM